MEKRKLKQIDSLIADETFHNAIQSLHPNEPVPKQIVNFYRDMSRETIELARQIILTSLIENDSADYSNKDKIWKRITEASIQFDNEEQLSEPKLSVIKRTSSWKRWIQYAAVIGGLVFLFTWNAAEKILVTDEAKVSSEQVIKVNPSGQKSRITLPDGSIAHLNAESELRYESNFTDNNRILYLKKGEAYFEVIKDKENPFTVVIEEIMVTALGTQFNVNTYSKNLEIALVEGSVLVNNASNDERLIMEPTEVLELDPVTNEMSIKSRDAREASLWKDQIMTFNNTAIDEAIKTLSRWYAVKINFKTDPPADLTVSGEFNNSSLELVLNNLSYSLDFEYKIEHKDITIKFNK